MLDSRGTYSRRVVANSTLIEAHLKWQQMLQFTCLRYLHSPTAEAERERERVCVCVCV